MRKSLPIRFLIAALLSGSAWAQGLQNNDMFFAGGPAWNKSQAVAGTSLSLAEGHGYTYQTAYGYQFARMSAVTLMADVSFGFTHSGKHYMNPMTLGLRLMIPVHERLTFYTVSGGGGGLFSVPKVYDGVSPSVSTRLSVHGVIVFGGGADVRLSRFFSLRAEVRDFVTGRGLSGSDGRNHAIPVFGVALHF